MRKLLLALWLLVPVGAFAYHLGPGQERVAIDEASVLIDEAERQAALAREVSQEHGDAAARVHWQDAEAAYEEALRLLPEELTRERRALRLERAKAQMNISELPSANSSLKGLVEEMTHDEEADPSLLADAREAYASSQYFMTWLMRLEGAAREVWEPEIDIARQLYKLLAEQADERGDDDRFAPLDPRPGVGDPAREDGPVGAAGAPASQPVTGLRKRSRSRQQEEQGPAGTEEEGGRSRRERRSASGRSRILIAGPPTSGTARSA